jgi:hypothetical protein
MRNCQLSTRDKIRAFRAGNQILIVAEGELPTPGFDVDVKQRPERIFPPQFDLLRCPKSGVFPQVVTPYRYAEAVLFPVEADQVTVHHADGIDQVDIENCGEELAAFERTVVGGNGEAEVATGFSSNLSFDEAFANALANLPPTDAPFADALARVDVQQIGGLFGGFPGFRHLFVQVSRTIT